MPGLFSQNQSVSHDDTMLSTLEILKDIHQNQKSAYRKCMGLVQPKYAALNRVYQVIEPLYLMGFDYLMPELIAHLDHFSMQAHADALNSDADLSASEQAKIIDLNIDREFVKKCYEYLDRISTELAESGIEEGAQKESLEPFVRNLTSFVRNRRERARKDKVRVAQTCGNEDVHTLDIANAYRQSVGLLYYRGWDKDSILADLTGLHDRALCRLDAIRSGIYDKDREKQAKRQLTNKQQRRVNVIKAKRAAANRYLRMLAQEKKQASKKSVEAASTISETVASNAAQKASVQPAEKKIVRATKTKAKQTKDQKTNDKQAVALVCQKAAQRKKRRSKLKQLNERFDVTLRAEEKSTPKKVKKAYVVVADEPEREQLFPGNATRVKRAKIIRYFTDIITFFVACGEGFGPMFFILASVKFKLFTAIVFPFLPFFSVPAIIVATLVGLSGFLVNVILFRGDARSLLTMVFIDGLFRDKEGKKIPFARRMGIRSLGFVTALGAAATGFVGMLTSQAILTKSIGVHAVAAAFFSLPIGLATFFAIGFVTYIVVARYIIHWEDTKRNFYQYFICGVILPIRNAVMWCLSPLLTFINPSYEYEKNTDAVSLGVFLLRLVSLVVVSVLMLVLPATQFFVYVGFITVGSHGLAITLAILGSLTYVMFAYPKMVPMCEKLFRETGLFLFAWGAHWVQQVRSAGAEFITAVNDMIAFVKGLFGTEATTPHLINNPNRFIDRSWESNPKVQMLKHIGYGFLNGLTRCMSLVAQFADVITGGIVSGIVGLISRKWASLSADENKIRACHNAVKLCQRIAIIPCIEGNTIGQYSSALGSSAVGGVHATSAMTDGAVSEDVSRYVNGVAVGYASFSMNQGAAAMATAPVRGPNVSPGAVKAAQEPAPVSAKAKRVSFFAMRGDARTSGAKVNANAGARANEKGSDSVQVDAAAVAAFKGAVAG